MLEQHILNEFEELNNQYGKRAVIKDIDMIFENEKFFDYFWHNLNTDRRAEVGFALRYNGGYVAVRSNGYPKGIFRIPTGGIGFEESVLDALNREVKEELGVDFKIVSFLGIIVYNITYKDKKLKFYSYMFELEYLDKRLIADATENEISEYITVDANGLEKLERLMKAHKGSWKDWCAFRAQTTGFICTIHH